MERSVPLRHEYYQGEVFAMGGASLLHNQITLAIASRLFDALRDSPCTVAANDLRVRIPDDAHYVYPDVVVTCEKPEFEDDQFDTLLNPQVIIEVLSASTENYDRGKKFEQYRRIASLKEYFLVAQDRPHIERFRRSDSDAWVLTESSGLDSTITIDSAGLKLSLDDVYSTTLRRAP